MKIIFFFIFLILGLLSGFTGWTISNIGDSCIFATICEAECAAVFFLSLVVLAAIANSD